MGELRRVLASAAIWTAAMVCAPWLAGCSATTATAPAGMVQTAASESRPRWVDREDDGREPQVAPPRRESPPTDDPTEPFSPNYGSAPARAATSPLRRPSEDLKPDFAGRLAIAAAD
jgi:hypothetical protein